MSSRRAILALLVLALAVVLLRLPAVLYRQPIDEEATYTVVANEILDGGHPYVDAVERKPPLIFWTYAALFAAAGRYNFVALHALGVMWTIATMAGVYLLARRIFDRETGLVAAMLYGAFACWATVHNLPFNGELMMNLPIAWAWALAIRPPAASRARLALAGALLCVASLFKQPAAVAVVPIGIYLLRKSFAQAAWLSIGFCATLAFAAGVLYEQRILFDAFYWTVADHLLPHIFWSRAIEHTLSFVGACLPLVAGAALALRDDALWNERRGERAALAGLLAVSAVGAAAGARFYPHYYIQLVLPLAPLAAAYWRQRSRAVVAIVAPFAVAFAVAHAAGLAAQPESTAAGAYIRRSSHPDDRIFVWGQEARIYVDARRQPASRYVTSFALTGYIFGPPLPGVDTSVRIRPGAWANLMTDFARHPPEYIVDVQWNPDVQYPIARFPLLAHLIAEHYEPVLRTPEGVVYARRALID